METSNPSVTTSFTRCNQPIQSSKEIFGNAPRKAWDSLRIIIGAGIGMFLNIGPVLLFTFGLFIMPINKETGWSTVSLASAIGPAMLVTALLQPAIGYLLDRFGIRRCALISFALFGTSLCALGLGPQTQVTFTIFLVLATFMGAAQTPLPYSYLIARSFDKQRGLALGVVLSFSGLGVAVWPLIVGGLLTTFSWRQAYLAIGIIVLVLGALAVLLIRDPLSASSDGRPSVQPGINADGMTLREAIATGPFWCLVVVFFIMSAIITGGTVHLPALLVSQGLTLQMAASFASVVGITSIAARLVIGWALDRFNAPIVSFAVFLAPAIGSLLLWDGGVSAFVCAALLGIGLGAEADVLAYIASRAFGTKHFGKVYGALMVVFLIGVSAGPALFAYALDGHGGYPMALLLSGLAGTGAAALMLCWRPKHLSYGDLHRH